MHPCHALLTGLRRHSTSSSPMSATEWRISVDGDEIAAIYEPATTASPLGVFVCAHGAGGHMNDRAMLAVTEALRGRGLATVRFNFPYRQKGSSRPDAMPRLERTVAEVVAHTRREIHPELLVVGGRSMGGRAASMLAAKGLACDGLLLLAYPLHPAGSPEKLRDAHLGAIEVPVLCFSGTRDALCRRDLMEKALDGLHGRWTMHWLEGADHGFHVLKSSGTTDAGVLTEVADVTQRWVAGLSPRVAS